MIDNYLKMYLNYFDIIEINNKINSKYIHLSFHGCPKSKPDPRFYKKCVICNRISSNITFSYSLGGCDRIVSCDRKKCFNDTFKRFISRIEMINNTHKEIIQESEEKIGILYDILDIDETK